MKKRILLTRRLHDFALKELRRHYSIKTHKGKIPMPKNTLIKEIKNADGLICFPYDTVDKDVIDAAPNLKTISTYSVGFDHIDLESATKRKIRVGYTPDVLTDATADLTVTLMLDLLRRVAEGDRIIRRGGWKQIYGAYDFVGVDINKKTLGILGMGRIGRAVAKRAQAFGMNIIYHNRNRLSKKIESSISAKYVSFDRLLRSSDVLSLHIPYNKDTHGIIQIDQLNKMKKSAFLVNTARGKAIRERDLVAALKKKTIAGAALDVFEGEPIGKNHPLARMENVVLAPHIGSSTKETREEMARLTVYNLNRGMAGKRPKYSVGF